MKLGNARSRSEADGKAILEDLTACWATVLYSHYHCFDHFLYELPLVLKKVEIVCQIICPRHEFCL